MCLPYNFLYRRGGLLGTHLQAWDSTVWTCQFNYAQNLDPWWPDNKGFKVEQWPHITHIIPSLLQVSLVSTVITLIVLIIFILTEVALVCLIEYVSALLNLFQSNLCITSKKCWAHSTTVHWTPAICCTKVSLSPSGLSPLSWFHPGSYMLSQTEIPFFSHSWKYSIVYRNYIFLPYSVICRWEIGLFPYLGYYKIALPRT